MTHYAGTPLTISAGQAFAGGFALSDFVNCQGRLSAISSGSINLNGGVSVSGSGNVNLGNGGFSVSDSQSGITAGSLTADYGYVGYSDSGTFTQSGGTNNVGYGGLYLGYNSLSSGTVQVLVPENSPQSMSTLATPAWVRSVLAAEISLHPMSTLATPAWVRLPIRAGRTMSAMAASISVTIPFPAVLTVLAAEVSPHTMSTLATPGAGMVAHLEGVNNVGYGGLYTRLQFPFQR